MGLADAGQRPFQGMQIVGDGAEEADFTFGGEPGTFLESYVNRDLRDVPMDEIQALTDLIGVADDTQARFGFRPWYVWKTGEGDTRYIVFEGFKLIVVPGNSQAGEIGEMTQDEQVWRQFFEMTLQREVAESPSEPKKP
jgi:hypothetical protein